MEHSRHQDGAHGAHMGHSPEMFRSRFWLTLLLTIPLVVTSHMVMGWFGYHLDFPGIEWVGPILGTFVYLWGGRPFLQGGWHELQARRPAMMLLISMAITVAYAASMATSLGWFDMDFWWELGALVTIMLLGHWQEMKAVGQASSALEALAALLPDDAERLDANGDITVVPATTLAVGDTVLVRPGGRVPADGDVVEGTAELDEAMITGESRPVLRTVGEHVVAGTVSTDAMIRVQVTAVGDDTALAGIQRLVSDAQSSASRAQVLADRFAGILFYVATVSAVVTFVVWSALGHVDRAVENTVSVLVIACPHALGLAIPLVVAISTALAARNGILVTDRSALETMRTVDVVLFDKTGTLTEGNHVVTDIAAADSTTASAVVATAASVERFSEHPLAKAIVARAEANATVPEATDFENTAGRGVSGTLDGHRVEVGGPALLRATGAEPSGSLLERTETWAARGVTVLYLLEDGVVTGAFALEDQVRPEARQAIDDLASMHVEVAMLTGDARQVADAVGADLRITRIYAEVAPADKDHAVIELQRDGTRVAMVGDGVNDAPALVRADVGLAIGAGTDVAIEAADIVLASSDPRGVAKVIRLSAATYRKMRQNLAWAAGYNIVAIPLAAGVLAPIGFTMPPAVGAVAMSLSTIIVALNAQLLRGVNLSPTS